MKTKSRVREEYLDFESEAPLFCIDRVAIELVFENQLGSIGNRCGFGSGRLCRDWFPGLPGGHFERQYGC